MNSLEKTVLLCAIMFGLVFLATPDFSTHADYVFHFEKAKDASACPSPYLQESCDDYPVLMHVLAHPFTFSQTAYYYFLLFLSLLVIPLVLDHYAGWKSVLFYFSSYAWTEGAVSGTLAQTGAMIVFVLFYFNKNPFMRLALLVVSMLVHKMAFWLLLLFWASESLNEPLKVLFSKSRSLFPIGFPSFPSLGLQQVFDLGVTFVRQTNLIAFAVGIKQIVERERFFLLVPILASFFMALGRIDRALWVMHLVIAIEAGSANLRKYELYYAFVFIAYVVSQLFFATGWALIFSSFIVAFLGAYVLFRTRVF